MTLDPAATTQRRPSDGARVPGPIGVERWGSWGAAAGAVAVVAWWWANTPYVHGLGDWLTNAGRITGLLAGYLLALLLLVMSRAPVLDHRIGPDRLARWHAMLGRYTVGLVVAHGLLTWWGYAVSAHTGLLHQGSTLLLSYPDVLMATAAALLLVGVGAVSARAVRRRLRYETWYYLHLYTYLAVALSFAHVFATGQEFATHWVARVLWSALYIVAAGCLAWYRLAVPVYRSWRHRAQVERVVVEGPGVVSLVLHSQHLEELAIRPGQFVRLRFLTREHWWTALPFSLSAAPNGDLLRVTVKALGDHTSQLPQLRVGTRVLVEGPSGALTAERRTKRKVLLLAGGIGVTPMRALFQSMPAAPREIALLYRAEREEEFVLRDELDELARRRQQVVRYLPGAVGGPNDVLVDDRLRQLVPDLLERDVFVSGPPAFIVAAEGALHRLRVPRGQVHVENFAF